MCRLDIELGGNSARQRIVMRAIRYGAGKQQVLAQKEFTSTVALPPGIRSWKEYWPLLGEKDRKKMQHWADGVDKKLRKDGWVEVANQEYRRKLR